MAQTPVLEHLIDQLVEKARALPPDKLMTLIDFAGYLQSHYGRQRPERGSPEAILQALERIGPLQFEPGELDQLLEEIEHMRLMDLEAHG